MPIARRKATGLLAYLAVTQKHHSREGLATLFWPEYDRRSGRADLSRTLSVLNKALGPSWLVADREAVTLNFEADLWVDVVRFRQLQAATGAHGHAETRVCPACLPLLGEAVRLVQADFLAGFTLAGSPGFDEWQLLETEGLRRELTGVLERLVLGYSALGEWERAIAFARQWVEREPLHEQAHIHLMRLYAHNGQRADALAQFAQLRRELEEELGVDPGPDAQALDEQIRSGEQKPPMPAGESFVDLPRQRPSFLDERAAPLTGQAPAFVARERELAQLDEHLQTAVHGDGRVVFITGEAGRGKTALLGEFARRAQAEYPDLIVAMGTCNAHTGYGDPYVPFRDVMSMLTGDVEARWAAGTITRGQAIRLWNLLPQTIKALAESGPDLLDVFVARATLLRRAAAQGLGDAALSPQVLGGMLRAQTVTQALEPRHLFEQYTQVLTTLAARQPLLLLLDDLQWVDGASANLLFHLGRRLAGSRILIVGAYRASEVAQGAAGDLGSAGPHPLRRILTEFIRQYGTIQVDLGQRAPADAQRFVEALLDREPSRLGDSFRRLLIERTQGHPLFTVELLRDMQERGDLVQDEEGVWIEGSNLVWDGLPARVEAVIQQRLERLEEPLRALLAVASVEGREFTAQVVARLQGLDEMTLLRRLSQDLEHRHRLVSELGEVVVGGQRLSRFQFRHVLFQHYLYDSLGVAERRLLHGRIAAALEDLFAGHTDQVAAQLARHSVEAGDEQKAVHYLIAAGDQARSLYAYQAASDYYEHALAYFKEGGSVERTARTLMKLGLTYHMALDFQRAAPVYEEGFRLWRHVGEREPDRGLPPAPHALRGHWSDPRTVDPALAGQLESMSIIDQLYSGLVEHGPDMNVVPAVARNWEVLHNGTTYLFHLRQDVRWSDGTPVTAADFEFAWKRLLDPATKAPEPSTLYDIQGAHAFHAGEVGTPDQVGVRALTPFTLRVDLEGPAGYFPHLLTLDSTYPVPRHAVEAHGQAWTEVEHIVTNGPFLLQAWDPGERMVLIRNPDYHGQFSGNIDRVELSLLTDRSVPLQRYQADEVDIVSHFALRRIPSREQEWVRQHFANDLVSAPGLYTNFLAFDTSRPPYDHPGVRKAFVLATNRASLVAARRSNELPATGGFVPPGMPGYSPGIGLAYDPDQARRLLAEAGYPGGRGFPEVSMLAFQSHIPFCKSLQAQWRETLGVGLNWQPLEASRYVRRLADEGVQLCILAWVADYPDPVNFLDLNDSIKMGQWRSERFAGLVARARRETEQQRRMDLYSQADRVLIEEAAIMPLTYGHKHILVKPWVKKYPISALKFWFWKDVVIEPH